MCDNYTYIIYDVHQKVWSFHYETAAMFPATCFFHHRIVFFHSPEILPPSLEELDDLDSLGGILLILNFSVVSSHPIGSTFAILCGLLQNRPEGPHPHLRSAALLLMKEISA